MQTSSFPVRPGKTAWRRDSLRVRLTSARSIEETGLDCCLYGDFLSPQSAASHPEVTWSKDSNCDSKTGNLIRKNVHRAEYSDHQCKCHHSNTQEADQDPGILGGKSRNHECTSKESFSEHGRVTFEDGQVTFDKKRQRKGHGKGGKSEFMARNESAHVPDIGKEEETAHKCESKGANGDNDKDHGPPCEKGASSTNFHSQKKRRARRASFQVGKEHASNSDVNSRVTVHAMNGLEGESQQTEVDVTKEKLDEFVFLERRNATLLVGNDDGDDAVSVTARSQSADSILAESSTLGASSAIEAAMTTACLQDIVKEDALPPSAQSLDDSLPEISTAGNYAGSLGGAVSSPADTTNSVFPGSPTVVREDSFGKKTNPLFSAKQDARSRWRRLKHTVTLVNHMAANMRSASHDLLEDSSLNEILQNQSSFTDDAGGVGAAAFEGAKTMARFRSHGRKGMEGLLVRQDKCFITFIQDFYVACLKMPIGHFLIGVFLAPLALGLLFTPLYLMDVDGLTFNGVGPADAEMCPVASAKQRCLAVLNVFLYALSLSTTFGGSPVAAVSPFCLLVANVNTLMSQFLFVFLSGAVFARMSQPSHPIRCSKKAVIKADDISPVLGVENKEKFKVFAVRLVLTGPSPCELVDAKICLTFRIFIKLPSGSVFCSTQDLELVRPEVSYLRYGLMVRHIIDTKSPVYGHTMDSLREGDASFSLTVMGSERTSMQPIFHLEDYFVCDDDVIWDGDYIDFIHINENGQRVLDHSKIDQLKPMKAAAVASQAISRMKNLAQQKGQEEKEADSREIFEKEISNRPGGSSSFKNWWMGGLQKRRLWKSKSTSFTRADW